MLTTFKKMDRVQAFSVAAYFCYFIMLAVAPLTSSQSAGFSLKLIPLFSPESPLYPGNLTQSERIQKMFEISKERAKYLASMSKPDALEEPEDIHHRVHEHNYFYSVEVSLGTPTRSQFLLFDTGSFLIWTQCLPCVNCFNQTTPIFNPNASSTYKKIPCEHPLCRRPFRCENQQCVYRRRYGGGASTAGFASTETFTFPFKNKFVSVPGVIFGCSNDNRQFSFNSNISGILGLNASPFSLLDQLKSTIQGLFSYCLVCGYREMEATSILRFGRDAIVRRKDMKTTPMFLGNIGRNFYLHLLDISVGDHRIGFAPGTFVLHRNGSGGCMIDTGAMATFIQKGPYEIVIRHFDEHFTSVGCQRVNNASEEWEYCYRYNSSFRAYISMTFHFQGADFKVEPTYMYFIYQNQGHFCVALSFYEDSTIVGAWQQQDTRFIYDLNMGSLRFVSENCANDHL